MKTTHTLALMEVSNATFVELINKMHAAGYDHAIEFDRDRPLQPMLDMSGIGVMRDAAAVTNERDCHTAYANHYHKVRAELSYDEWRVLWVVGKAPGQVQPPKDWLPMAMTTDVERDLSHIVRQDEGEDRQAFLLRALEAMYDITVRDWLALETASRCWVHHAIYRRSRHQPLPDFPGRAT